VAYRESSPPRALAPYVACLWTRSVEAGEDAVTILPDGCIDLVAYDDGRLLVAGPDTGPARSDLAGVGTVAGVRFRPGVAPAVLGVSAEALRDGRLPLPELWGSAGERLAEIVGGAFGERRNDGLVTEAAEAVREAAWSETGTYGRKLTTAGAKSAVRAAGPLTTLVAAVDARTASAPAPDPIVRAAVERLAATPTARVSTLADDLAISERQLRRRFHASVGYGPKVLARVLRLQRLLALAKRPGGDLNLARLAADAGYADHPHMVDETVALTGQTPGVLLRDRFAQDAPPLAA
jgi:AraC-like DNA-binding protein